MRIELIREEVSGPLRPYCARPFLLALAQGDTASSGNEGLLDAEVCPSSAPSHSLLFSHFRPFFRSLILLPNSSLSVALWFYSQTLGLSVGSVGNCKHSNTGPSVKSKKLIFFFRFEELRPWAGLLFLSLSTEERGEKGVNRVWQVCSLSGKKRGEGFQCCPRE
jgi:hypothetical protein